MPHIQFLPAPESTWESLPMGTVTGIPALKQGKLSDLGSVPALLLPGGPLGVTLITRPDVPLRVNGRAVPGGIRVLEDRDEIRLESRRFYFSAHDPLFVETYQEQPTPCPRCSAVIPSGSDAVRCHCGAWFHQSSEHECFTYGDSCPSCSGPTRLDKSPWNPSSL